MKFNVDVIAREAFTRMVAEAGETRSVAVPPEPPSFYIHASHTTVRRPRVPLALVLTVAAFCALAVIPPIAARGRPSFAEAAALLPSNPQLERYAELLADSRSLLRNR